MEQQQSRTETQRSQRYEIMMFFLRALGVSVRDKQCGNRIQLLDEAEFLLSSMVSEAHGKETEELGQGDRGPGGRD
jgi:hypothetical protein